MKKFKWSVKLIAILSITGCATAVSPISENKYLLDIYNLPNREEAENKWHKKAQEICKSGVYDSQYKISLMTKDALEHEFNGESYLFSIKREGTFLLGGL